MTIPTAIRSLRGPGMRNILAGLRCYLRGRRILWLIAAAAFAAGLMLRWNWLVAAGVAPIIVGLLPCAAMCALGFCAFKAIGPDSQPPPPGADTKSDSDGTS
jgi:hypothetical protein